MAPLVRWLGTSREKPWSNQKLKPQGRAGSREDPAVYGNDAMAQQAWRCHAWCDHFMIAELLLFPALDDRLRSAGCRRSLDCSSDVVTPLETGLVDASCDWPPARLPRLAGSMCTCL